MSQTNFKVSDLRSGTIIEETNSKFKDVFYNYKIKKPNSFNGFIVEIFNSSQQEMIGQEIILEHKYIFNKSKKDSRIFKIFTNETYNRINKIIED